MINTEIVNKRHNSCYHRYYDSLGEIYNKQIHRCVILGRDKKELAV